MSIQSSDRFRVAFLYVALVLGALMTPALALAQENGDCLACHGDKDLSKQRDGKKVSLFIDEAKLGASVHGRALCVDCHADLKGAELPHQENLQKPTCTGCHTKQNADYGQGLHGTALARGHKLAPGCSDCHGSHEIVPVHDPRSPVTPVKIPFLCGRCHHEGSAVHERFDIPQSRILENYTESIHGEALLKKGSPELRLPPPLAIAHQLVKSWVEQE